MMADSLTGRNLNLYDFDNKELSEKLRMHEYGTKSGNQTMGTD